MDKGKENKRPLNEGTTKNSQVKPPTNRTHANVPPPPPPKPKK